MLREEGLLVKDSRIHKVKPFYKEWCAGCMLNGCYPWNRNPILLCSLMGGLVPQLSEVDSESGNEVSCLSCEPVTSELWLCHVEDEKREAKWNEEVRTLAMRSGALSNQILPAEVSHTIMLSEEKVNEALKYCLCEETLEDAIELVKDILRRNGFIVRVVKENDYKSKTKST